MGQCRKIFKELQNLGQSRKIWRVRELLKLKTNQVLRAIPTDRYSYPHGQCRRWTSTLLNKLCERNPMMSVLASLVTCLAEVSTGWVLTTSELDFLSCLKIGLVFPGMVMELKTSWACGLFWPMAGLQKSLLRRLRSENLFIFRNFHQKTFPQILSPTRSTVTHTDNNNLFFALRGAGSSYGVVTQFKYKHLRKIWTTFGVDANLRYIVHEVPEAKPAILLAWADSSADLAAIKAAGQVLD